METLHNASLIMDDMEDNSLKRRGEDCCHIKYGLPLAINSGTTTYFLALNYILSMEDKAKRAQLLEVAVREMTNLHLGQNQDIVWNRDIMGSDYKYKKEDYLTLCKHKTSGLIRIVISSCLVLSPEKYSENIKSKLEDLYNGIGILFQIVDDILNLEESAVAANKSARGEDIREGNKTIITIDALEHAESSKRDRLMDILKMKTLDQLLIEEAIGICEEAGSVKRAKQFARQMADDLTAMSQQVLKHAGVKDLMAQLIQFIYARKN